MLYALSDSITPRQIKLKKDVLQRLAEIIEDFVGYSNYIENIGIEFSQVKRSFFTSRTQERLLLWKLQLNRITGLTLKTRKLREFSFSYFWSEIFLPS